MKLKTKYVLREVADKTVAIAVEQGNEKTDGVITLNDSGAFIFALLNDGAQAEEIKEKFFGEYDVTREDASDAVDSFINTLKEANLIED